jgi:hypothetical protein
MQSCPEEEERYMTLWNTIRVIGNLVVGVVGIALWVNGQRTLGSLLLLASIAGAFLSGRPILGDPTGVGRLPEGVTAADVKAHRERHGGSISDALRALSRRTE